MASILYISEFSVPTNTVNLQQIGVAPQPSINDQTVTVGASSTQSTAFKNNTNLVRLNNDSGGACNVAFGTNPTATATNARIGANSAEYFTVPQGQAFKVAAIALTA